MKVIAYDLYPNQKVAEELGFEYVSLDELYAQSDIISLNCPLTKETQYMINRKSMLKMKDGVILVNTGRGMLIDSADLVEALKDKKIGAVAYQLQLPSHAMIHPVFHVSQLKACHSEVKEMGHIPQCDAEGMIAATPFKLLDRRMVKQGNRAVVFGLIQWSNGGVEDATWEVLSDIVKRFPEFVLFP